MPCPGFEFMSSTRTQKEPGKFRQEKFASSIEFERGAMANLVAKRTSLLNAAPDCELIWYLQRRSHECGMKQIAADLIAKYPQRLATPAMQKFGMQPDQIYSAAEVKEVRDAFPIRNFLLFGEMAEDFDICLLEHPPEPSAEARAAARKHPSKYPASAFTSYCRAEAKAHLQQHLFSLCLDPGLPVADGAPWYFPTLVSTLREEMKQDISNHCQKTVVTSLGSRVHEALDYTAETGSLTLIEGSARFGKTFAVTDWCLRHPGRARYVQLESSPDEMSFYRAIAKALGVSVCLQAKGQELRMRIEETLQSGQLVLVLDEAHYLWPNIIDSRSLPSRINWILTALVNRGVPVALVTTPQFFSNQRAIEQKTRWTSEQFTGRIGHYEKLPDVLPKDDLQKIAKALAGGVEARIIDALVEYANGSVRYIASIGPLVTRARYFARKDNREKFQFADLRRALSEVIPSDNAIAAAIEPAPRPLRRGFAATKATVSRVEESRLQPNFNRAESVVSSPDLLPERAPDRRAAADLVH